jgi:hypothetical protein
MLRAAMQWLKRNPVALESAHGLVPTFADFVAGERIRGSWWGHPKGKEIFRLSRLVRDSPDVIVNLIVNGKITYVYRDAWPALVRLSDCFPADRLAALKEVHTASGRHKIQRIRFLTWIPRTVAAEAKKLSEEDAMRMLGDWVAAVTSP